MKPSALHASFPMIAFDSQRKRLVYYDPATLELWQYSIAANTWSIFTATGSGPNLGSLTGIISTGSSNCAGYDPHTDIMVVMFSLGQSKTPGVFELAFGSPPAPDTLAPGVPTNLHTAQ